MSVILLLIALLAAGQIETGEACIKKMDLLLGLDGSSTVCGGDEPCENWEALLQFSKNITTTLNIGSTQDRVALMTFANTTEIIWDLRKYTAMIPLLTAIGGVTFKGGVFNDVVSAFDIVTEVFSIAAGDDVDLPPLLPGRKNVVLAITDGIPSLDERLAVAASLLIQKCGITLFVVCIRTGCTESWAKAIASKPKKADLKTYFLVDSFSALNNAVKDTVMENICYFLEDQPLLPPLLPTPLVEINANLTNG